LDMMKWFPYAMDDPNAGVNPGSFTIPPSVFGLSTLGVTQAPTNDVNIGESNANKLYSAVPTCSFPVLIDPVGWQANTGTKSQFWFGNPPPTSTLQTAIPRRTLCTQSWKDARTSTSTVFQSFTPLTSNRIWHDFYLRDDLTFNLEQPTPQSTGTALERAARYSFAYLVRRTDNVFRRSPPNVWVVVYQGRSMDAASEEKVYSGTISVPGVTGTQTIPDMPSSVRLSFPPGESPPIRAGTWVMDASINSSAGFTTSTSTIQGYFYRVIDASEPNRTTNTIDITLERPLQFANELNQFNLTSGTTGNRIFVIPDSVVHVAQVY
jgi:hypothetical protein